MAPHCSTLVWKSLWMEELGRLQSMGSQRVQHIKDFPFTFHFHALEKAMATHSSVLAWRIPGTGEPGGLLSTGLHRVRHDGSDLAAAAAAIYLHIIYCCFHTGMGRMSCRDSVWLTNLKIVTILHKKFLYIKVLLTSALKQQKFISH